MERRRGAVPLAEDRVRAFQDRTGQVWECELWSPSELLLIVGPPRPTKWDPAARLHPALELESGKQRSVVEYGSHDLERIPDWTRVA